MKRFNLKSKAVSLSVLLLVLASLAGCTAADVLTLKTVNESDQVESVVRFSPSYHLDDPALTQGAAGIASMTVAQFSPSYYLDDPALTQAVAGIPSMAVAQFSPSYYLDDPTLTEGINTAISYISSLLAVQQ